MYTTRYIPSRVQIELGLSYDDYNVKMLRTQSAMDLVDNKKTAVLTDRREALLEFANIIGNYIELENSIVKFAMDLPCDVYTAEICLYNVRWIVLRMTRFFA